MIAANFDRIWSRMGDNPTAATYCIVTNNGSRYMVGDGGSSIYYDRDADQIRFHTLTHVSFVDVAQIEEIMLYKEAAWPMPYVDVKYAVTTVATPTTTILPNGDGLLTLTGGTAYKLDATTSASVKDNATTAVYSYVWNFSGMRDNATTGVVASVTPPDDDAANYRPSWMWFLTVKDTANNLINTIPITVAVLSS